MELARLPQRGKVGGGEGPLKFLQKLPLEDPLEGPQKFLHHRAGRITMNVTNVRMTIKVCGTTKMRFVLRKRTSGILLCCVAEQNILLKHLFRVEKTDMS